MSAPTTPPPEPPTGPPRAYRVHGADNVATLLQTCEPGVIEVGGENPVQVRLTSPIEAAHKVALQPIARGEDVVKFSQPIGQATTDIQTGDWVHLHNVASHYDERAAHYDKQTGVPDDHDDAYL